MIVEFEILVKLTHLSIDLFLELAKWMLPNVIL